jgi:hypothetical protein
VIIVDELQINKHGCTYSVSVQTAFTGRLPYSGRSTEINPERYRYSCYVSYTVTAQPPA